MAAGTRVLLEPGDLGRVEPDDRERRLGPEPLDAGAAADPARRRRRRRTRRAAAPRGSRRRPRVRRTGPRRRRCPRRRGRVAIRRERVIRESGTRPPHMPECTAWVRVRTSTSRRTRPRRLVVRAGTPMSQLPLSAITMTSARRSSRCCFRRAGRLSEPTSSSPSTNITTLTGRSSPWTRIAPRWAAMPALSSAAPRRVQPPVALGRLERRGVPVGVVVLGLDVVVGVEQDGRGALARRRLVGDHGRATAVGAGDLARRSPRRRTGRAPPRRCAAPRPRAPGRR